MLEVTRKQIESGEAMRWIATALKTANDAQGEGGCGLPPLRRTVPVGGEDGEGAMMLPQSSSRRPRLLDLYCGAGGAAVGYHEAGFEVTGVDIVEQPRYPFVFHRADALEFCREHGHEFDVIHASPPCQAYSTTRTMHSREYSMDIPAVREALMATGKIYVIENVAGAKRHMHHPIMLCGTMFDLRVYRHRLFESNMLLFQPEHPPHTERCVPMGKRPRPGQYMTVTGNFGGGIDYARQCMGIELPFTRRELAQAIPPAYTEYIGSLIYAFLRLEGRR